MTLLADGGRRARGAHVQRGGRLGDARGEQLRAMALAAAARRLRGQPLDLLLAHSHRLEVLARKQHLRGPGARVKSRAALSAAPAPVLSAAAPPMRHASTAAPGQRLGRAGEAYNQGLVGGARLRAQPVGDLLRLRHHDRALVLPRRHAGPAQPSAQRAGQPAAAPLTATSENKF